MLALEKMIAEFKATTVANIPSDIKEIMQQATLELKQSGIENRALQTGDQMPDFVLPDQYGNQKRLYDYLKESPVILNIYRGSWCPYCNFEMKAFSDLMPKIQEKGAQLIGMSSELPTESIKMAKNNGIDIDILYDAKNLVSEKLGLIFTLPEPLRPIYEQFGIDIPKHHGDDTFKLPLPATYIINQDTTVKYAFVNADYTERAEPSEIINRL